MLPKQQSHLTLGATNMAHVKETREGTERLCARPQSRYKVWLRQKPKACLHSPSIPADADDTRASRKNDGKSPDLGLEFELTSVNQLSEIR